MKKIVLLALLGVLFLVPCFSQNMLLFGGESTFQLKNYDAPRIKTAGIGFNLKVLDYFQNDLTVNFGVIDVKEINNFPHPTNSGEYVFVDTGLYMQKNIFMVADKFYLALDTKWIGFRAGVFAGVGVYHIYIDSIPLNVIGAMSPWDLFLNGGGFVGICLFPKSLFALAVDLNPGYSFAFRAGDPELHANHYGFSLSLSLSLRLNLDKI